MKVLGLVGSGRKDGNTNALVEQILAGARSGGHVTEKVFLADLTILPIRDCSVCRKLGHCQMKDDFEPLLQKMLGNDCIIFGTPVYWVGPAAQLKAFIDRWSCRLSLDGDGFRASMKGKRCLLAIPHQAEELSGAEHLIGMMEGTFNYLEMAYLGKIQTNAYRRWEVSKDEVALKYAFELGARLTELEGVQRATGAVTFNFGRQSEAEPPNP